MTKGYSIGSYGSMVDCEPRMSAYAEALRRAIVPGCTVIDIGAGFGIFSLLACQYGAGSVIAIEPDDSIELLEPLAAANGFGDRITVVRDLSTRYTPAAKADVVVSDIRGILPLFEHHVATIKDARDRLLAPGGRLIPARDMFRIALAHCPGAYRFARYPWTANRYKLDLSAGRRFAVNEMRKVYLSQSNLLSQARDLAPLDYSSITDPNLDAEVELEAEKSGTAHGLAIWFDAEIGPGIGFSNAPGCPKQVYGQTFFPFAEVLKMERGDRLKARIRANFVSDAYVWTWDSTFMPQGRDARRLNFRQSTFLGKVHAPDKLARRSSRFVPGTDPRQEIDRACIKLIDGKRNLAEIAARLAESYSHEFPTPQLALDYVTALAERYSAA